MNDSELKKLRLAKNLSLKAVASTAGIHPSYLSKVERGAAKPSSLILSQIEATLGPLPNPVDNGNGTSSVIKDASLEIVDVRNQLNDLSGTEWIKETKSIWKQKGLGSDHPHTKFEKLHPAPFSFQDVARLIRFFTKRGMLVLDPFVGVGSTLKAAALEGRKAIGIELSKKWAELARLRLEEEIPGYQGIQIWCMDVKAAIPRLSDDSMDLIVTSPPYWAILNKRADHKVKKVRLAKGLDSNYSSDPRDLGNIEDYQEFLSVLSGIFSDLSAKLRPGKYCVIIVSDFKHGNRFYSFHSDLCQAIAAEKLQLQGITILEQTHKALYPYGYPFALVPNIHHQYLLIFRRPGSLRGNNGSNGADVSVIRRGKKAHIPRSLTDAVAQFKTFPYKTGEMASRHWGHRRHEMCSFPSKVKPGLASVLVNLFTTSETTVLDPFSGCGSIPFEAALQGRTNIGTDISPLAAVITSAKVNPPVEKDVEKLLARLKRYLKEKVQRCSLSEMESEIQDFYHQETAREIVAAREFLRQETREFQKDNAGLFVTACLAHILHGNRPYALSRRSHNIIPIPPKGPRVYKSVTRSLEEKCARMLSSPLPERFKKGRTMITEAHRLPLDSETVDVVITSPPFLGTTHFLRQNRIRNWLVGWNYEKQQDMRGKCLEHQKGGEAYRPILRELRRVLREEGLAIFHVGVIDKVNMADLLSPLFIEAGFREIDRAWEDARSLETHGRTDRGSTHTHGFLIFQKGSSSKRF